MIKDKWNEMRNERYSEPPGKEKSPDDVLTKPKQQL